MNSKIKFLLCFILVQNTSFAQTSFEYSSGSFNVTLAPINPDQSPPKAFYSIFLETGNGRYTKSGQINDSKRIQPFVFAYPYQINTNSRALATVSSYYDTTPRPPRNTAIAVSNPMGQLPNDQTNLPIITGKPQTRIGIDPCVSVVVPGDTMALALIYKPFVTPGTTNIIAFYYNKPLEGGNIFNQINSQTHYSFKGPDLTKAIRTHNNEAIYTSLPDGLPPDVMAKLNTAHTDYSDAIYFIIPAGLNESEKNIFLSLVPTKNTISYNGNTSTGFAATIIQYSPAGTVAQQNFYSPLGINMVARDPNGIVTSPHCFMGNEGIVDPHDISITHKIKFENDGPGDAKDIVITVTVPEGIKIPAQITDAFVIRNGTARLFKPWTPGETYYYSISNRNIVFTMKNIFLKGTTGERNPLRRSGIITFNLKTNSAPLVIPDCMYTFVSIVFINKDRSANKPVTGRDLIRSNCSNTQPCPLYSKAGSIDTR